MSSSSYKYSPSIVKSQSANQMFAKNEINSSRAPKVELREGRRTNLKSLLSAGLKPGDVFVWKRRPEIVSSNFQGHAQTVQTVLPPVFDAGGNLITEGSIVLLQGNMSGGQGKGELQQRVYTFAQLTGSDTGDDRIVFEPRFGEEFFFGAGTWKG